MRARNVLVTGASSGIGRAVATEAARRGATLTLVARDEDRLREVRDELAGAGHGIVVADLSDTQDLARVADLVAQDQINVLVNAAGIGLERPFPLGSLGDERRQIDLNVGAVLTLSHAAATAMNARGSGAIVNVSSTAAYWSVGTYAASKAWVLAATMGLAAQCAPHGVNVMTLVPGFTRTQFHSRSATDASHVREWMWLDAADVARECLDALARGDRVCIPGRRYRVLVELVRHLPPSGRAAVLRQLAPLGPVAR